MSSRPRRPPGLPSRTASQNTSRPTRRLTDNLRNEVLSILGERGPKGLTALAITTELHRRGLWGGKRKLDKNLKGTVARNLRTMEASSLYPIGRKRSSGHEEGDLWRVSGEGGIQRPGMTLAEAVALSLVAEEIRQLLPASLRASLEPRLAEAEKRIETASRAEGSASRWRQKVRSVPRHLEMVPPPIDPKVLKEVQDAVLREQTLRIRYTTLNMGGVGDRAQRKTKEIVVEPYGLLQMGNKTYAVAREQTVGKRVQLYALHRMEEAIWTGSSRKYKPEDLDQFIADGRHIVGTNEHVLFEARVSKNLQKILRETPLAQTMEIEPDEDRYRIRATIRYNLALEQWVLGHGQDIQVLGPADLVRKLNQHVAGMRVAYGV